MTLAEAIYQHSLRLPEFAVTPKPTTTIPSPW